jgi:hypothetical protein
VAPSADALERTRSVSDPRAPGYDPKSPYYDVTADSSSTYYVGPLATDSPSGDAIRAQVTAQVDQEIAGHTSWLSKIIDPLIRDGKIQDLYEKRVAEARQQLHDRVDLRSPGGAPSTVWANASHEQMNAAISQNANSATVAQASEEWVSVGNELAEHQRNLAGAISASTANWQGSGGDAAREHLANVGKWLGSTAQGAMLTGRQQEIHSQTLNETQRLMAANPPVAFSVQDANARLQQITDPAQYAAQAQQDMQTYKTQQAARGQAARVMTDFDNTVGSAVATPVFAPPPKLPGMTPRTAGTNGGSAVPGAQMQPAMGTPAGATPAQGRVPALSADGTGGSGVTGGAGSPGGTAAPYGSGVPGSPGGPSGDAVHGSGGFGSGGSGGPGSGGPGGGSLAAAGFSGGGSVGTPGGVPPLYDSTSAAGYTPPTSHPGAPGFHVPPLSDGTTRGGSPYTGGGPGSGPSIPGGSPAGFTPGLGSSGTGSGGGSGRIPTIGRSGGVNGDSIASRLMGGSGAAGAGAGAGARLPGGGGAAGGGGRGIGGFPGGSGSSLAAGSASGAAAAAAAAEAEAAAGRSAAGAGRGTTTPGMGGMGGAKGNGDEDKEHRLADYLEPEDPSIFAADEVAAPPVIGDWKNTDWK